MKTSRAIVVLLLLHKQLVLDQCKEQGRNAHGQQEGAQCITRVMNADKAVQDLDGVDGGGAKEAL